MDWISFIAGSALIAHVVYIVFTDTSLTFLKKIAVLLLVLAGSTPYV